MNASGSINVDYLKCVGMIFMEKGTSVHHKTITYRDPKGNHICSPLLLLDKSDLSCEYSEHTRQEKFANRVLYDTNENLVCLSMRETSENVHVIKDINARLVVPYKVDPCGEYSPIPAFGYWIGEELPDDYY